MYPNKNTRTFAQYGEHCFILSNDEHLTFDNLDILKDKGWLVQTDVKTMSPYLPIGVLTKAYGPWEQPNKQLNVEEILKSYKF